MTDRTFVVVFRDAEDWHLYELRSAELSSPRTPAATGKGEDSLRTAFAEARYAGEPVAVLLSSFSCAAVQVTIELSKRQLDHEALTYAVEGELPWSAEELVAHIVSNHGSRAFVVAAESAPLVRLIAKLQDLGAPLQVCLIMPTALLAVQQLMSDLRWDDDRLLVWHDSHAIHLFKLSGGVLDSWTVAQNIAEVMVQVKMHRGQVASPTSITLISQSEEFTSRFEALEETSLQRHHAADVEGVALEAVVGRSTGHVPSIADLRRGPLEPSDLLGQLRPAVNWLCVSAVVLLTATFAALLLRSHQYERLVADEEAAQRRVFSVLYPAEQPPIDARFRLTSDLRRLRGLTGNQSPTDSPSALNVFANVFSALPSDLRFRILEVRIEESRLFLDGDAQSHGDAEKIVAAMRTRTGYAVDPPRTESHADNGVGFSIVATVPGNTLREER